MTKESNYDDKTMICQVILDKINKLTKNQHDIPLKKTTTKYLLQWNKICLAAGFYKIHPNGYYCVHKHMFFYVFYLLAFNFSSIWLNDKIL